MTITINITRILFWVKGKGFTAVGQWDSFTALSFLDSKEIPIYLWVDRESFPVIGSKACVQTQHLLVTFCTITNNL